MSQAVGALRVVLFANADEFRAGLNKAQRDLRRFQRRTQRVARDIEGVGARMSVAVTAPLLLFANRARQASRDAEELQSAFDVSFGRMAEDANRWAEETGKAFGRSTQTFQQAGFELQQLFRQAAPTEEAAFALSTAFAELASDAASFFNTTDDVALQRLRAGLAGEAEPLRRFGVFINEAAVQSRAFELGIAAVGDELSDQQKIIARASLIMEQLNAAQGDVLRTSGSLANQERALKEEFNALMIEVGDELRPVFLEMIAVSRNLIKEWRELDPNTKRLIIQVAALAATMGPLLIALGTFIRLVGFAAAAMIPLSKAFRAAGAAAGMSRTKLLAWAAAAGVAVEGGKRLGNTLFDATKDNDRLLATYARIPKLLGGMGLSADEAREAVQKLREEQARQRRELNQPVNTAAATVGDVEMGDVEAELQAVELATQATNAEIQELIKGLGNLSEPVSLDDIANDLDRINAMIDPITTGLKEYTRDLEFARLAGLDLATAQEVLAQEFVDSINDLDLLNSELGRLPESIRAAVEAANTDALQSEFERLRDTIFPVETALEEYTRDLELAQMAGIDAATAQRVLALEFINAAGGVGELKGVIETLPPAIQSAAENLEAMAEVTKTVKEETAKTPPEFGRLSRGLTDVITRGSSLSDMFSNLLQEILRMRVIEPFLNNLFSFGAGGDGTFSRGMFGFGNIFNPGIFRARGGFGAAGKALIVGEEGPELFVPNVSGMVRSHAESQQMVNNVSMTVNTPDYGSFKMNRRQAVRKEERMRSFG